MTITNINEVVPFIELQECEFEYLENEFVVNMNYREKKYTGIAAVPAFPLSSNWEFIHIYKNADSAKLANCVGIIENLDGLKASSQDALKNAVQMTCLMPKITRILTIKDEYYNFYWHVETDRGIKNFYIGTPRSHVTHISNGAILIKDVQNDFYLIPDPKDLDKISQQCLEPVL